MNNSQRDWLRAQLNKIQTKHNFNPNAGAKQVSEQPPEIQRAFGRFVLILEMIKMFELDIPIQYNNKTSEIHRPPEARFYLAQKGKTNIWKVGASQKPPGRKKQIQTGNDDTLFLRYDLPNGFAIEKVLKHCLLKYKTRDKNNANKGEWFVFTPKFVKALVSYIKDKNCDAGELNPEDIKVLAEKLN